MTYAAINGQRTYSLAPSNGGRCRTNAQFGIERLLAPIQAASLRSGAITQGDARRRACPGLIHLCAFSARWGQGSVSKPAQGQAGAQAGQPSWQKKGAEMVGKNWQFGSMGNSPQGR